MWVKICGMTRLKDARLAQDLGADAIGYIFAKSPRKITPLLASAISNNIKITKVGVFVNKPLEEIQAIRKECSLDIIQLHGEESPAFCDALGGKIIKAFRIKDEKSLARMKDYPMVWKFLLDAFVPGQRGGTGKRINTFLLEKIENPSQIILAGGLNPENVGQTLKNFSPFGIDVSSGVEKSPGIKDAEKLKNLFYQLNN